MRESPEPGTRPALDGTGDLSPATGAPDRLESWKEIANYLRRSVLTAQRWERTEGLPVHRHAHEKQASVYAFRSEIDRWRREREGVSPTREIQLEAPRAERPRVSFSPTRPHAIVAAVVIVGAALFVGAWRIRTNSLRRASLQQTRSIDVITEPPGAHFVVASEDGSDSIRYGPSPLRHLRVPRGVLRWRVHKDGYQPVDGLLEAWNGSLSVVLDRPANVPQGMVRVSGGNFDLGMAHLGAQPSFDLTDYWIDRYEVSNRAFKRFVDAGGYTNPRYWTEPFEKDGRRLSFAEAMRLFRDRTGRPGPASWDAGDFPSGKGEYPVVGVSWFEAMAYARFAGRSLPTIFHWSRAAGLWENTHVVPRSNFSGEGLAATGSQRGMSVIGAFDMAGNAKEWCFNATRAGRFILGGGWNEPVYMAGEADAQSPFARGENFGFRLAAYVKPPPPSLFAAIDYERRDFSVERPASNAVFSVIRGLYAYDHTPLRAATDLVDDSDERWRKELVSFDAAYGGERMTALMFLPRHAEKPYQAVVYFPGSGVIAARSSREWQPPWNGAIVKSGRAFVLPIYKGTFERADALATDYPARTDFYREHVLDWYKDLGRTIDYLATRPDLDSARTAYAGFSWGARLGPLFLALDPRLKAAVLVGGGLKFARTFPEVDPFNFASRATAPVLMVNGRYDYFFPLETSQRPLFGLLGTRAGDKRHVIFEAGHAPPQDATVTEVLQWLDRYLGPVARIK